MSTVIIASAVVFLLLTLILVVALLYAKSKLVPSGNVTITVNDERKMEVPLGGTLLNTLQNQGVFLSSACGGGGSCGQCRCRVVEGGGEILPTEKGFFSRKEQKDYWRLSCQTKVKEDLSIVIPEEVFGVKEWECEVLSNKNVSTFIKEFVVKLPEGETLPENIVSLTGITDERLQTEGVQPAKAASQIAKLMQNGPTLMIAHNVNKDASQDPIGKYWIEDRTDPMNPKGAN